MSFRRLILSTLAAAFLVAGAVDTASAQGLSTGPAGGVGSTTAPSNSQGTPSGGTGNIGTTRVGPSTTQAAPAPRRRARRPARNTRRTAPQSSIATPAFFG